ERRELVELVEHQVRVGPALQLDHHADRLAAAGAGLVADAADPGDPLLLDQLADGLQQPAAGDLEGDLADEDVRALALPLLDHLGPRPQGDLPPAAGVAVDDAL